MRQTFTNLQGDHFNLLESDASDPTNASDNGQSLAFTLVQISASPRDPNGSYGSIVLPPVTLAPVKTSNLFQPYHPLSVPSKSKRLSHSLPNSVTSSPRLGARWRRSRGRTSPPEGDATPSFVASLNSTFENDLTRSKSGGKGRASSPPSIDLDAVLDKLESTGLETCDRNMSRSASEDGEGRPKEEFKCGALCLFLPGFGKARPVRAKNKAEELTQDSMINISRSVSLEKFECGSWASSTIIAESKNYNKEDGDSSTNLYFDLPLELIRSSGNDANSPVTATFIFDNKELRGVLKSSSLTRATWPPARKSHESSRHVQFSTSTSPRSNPESPSSCITSRLIKAREDFNAFLEAQGA